MSYDHNGKEELAALLEEAGIYHRLFSSLMAGRQDPWLAAENLKPSIALRQQFQGQLEETIARVDKAKQMIDELEEEYQPRQKSSGKEALYEYLFGKKLRFPEKSSIKRFTFSLGFYVPQQLGSGQAGHSRRYFEFKPEEGNGFRLRKIPLEDFSVTRKVTRKAKLGELCFQVENRYYPPPEMATAHELKHIADGFLREDWSSELAAHLYTLPLAKARQHENEIKDGIYEDLNHYKSLLQLLYQRCNFSDYCPNLSGSSKPRWLLPQEITAKLGAARPLNPREEVFLREFPKYTGRLDVLEGFQKPMLNDIRKILNTGLAAGTLSFVIALTPVEEWPERLNEISKYVEEKQSPDS